MALKIRSGNQWVDVSASFTSDLSGGTAGDIVYQSAPNTTAFLADPGAGGNGYILTWDNANTRPAWSNPNTVGDGGGSGLLPTGSVFYFAAATAPTGYLSCNGALLSTTTYSALFAVIGYSYGGSGASFNLPDLRDRFLVGSGGSYSIRQSGGSPDATLVSHSHTGSATAPSGRHTHSIFTSGYSGSYGSNDADGGDGGFVTENGGDAGSGTLGIANGIRGQQVGGPLQGDTDVNGQHSHAVTLNPEGVSPLNANLPPYFALLPCIKY